MTATATWTQPALWSVPREWPGERCFVLCGGESVKAQRHLVPQLQGRVIAVKEGVLLRPDADVLFFAGERPEVIAPPLIRAFNDGEQTLTEYFPRYIVVRGKGHPVFPLEAKRVWRTAEHLVFSTDPTMVAGFDAGTSAINLAILFGSTEIILLGYDMIGGRWFTGEYPHPLPVIPEVNHQRHMAPLPELAADAKRKGIRIVNCSPISRVTCFERQPLEAFL
jgi:hypothetical protein